MTIALHTLTSTIRTAELLGADVPKNVRAEHDQLLALGADRRAFNVQHDLPSAVIAALATGNDPATDPDVMRQLVLQAVADSGPALSHAIDARARTLLTDHADALLDGFRKPFDDAAAVIVEQAAAGAPEPWGPAKDADQAISRIQQVRKTLAGIAPQMAVDPRYKMLAIADVPPAAFIDDNLASPGTPEPRAWDAARAGYPLSLANSATLGERIGAVYLELEDRQTALVEAGRDTYHRSHGFGERPRKAVA